MPSSTLLKKNYYTTAYQYLFNRCQTFDQRAFNFYSGTVDPDSDSDPLAKPGSALALSNIYVANCNPNANTIGAKSGCKLVVYKPNNPQFAQQGGVTSSTRTLKLNVTTIDKNIANIRQTNWVDKIKVEKCTPCRKYNPRMRNNI